MNKQQLPLRWTWIIIIVIATLTIRYFLIHKINKKSHSTVPNHSKSSKNIYQQGAKLKLNGSNGFATAEIDFGGENFLFLIKPTQMLI